MAGTMSGLQAANDERVGSVDVREQGNALRVATNTPHLVSLGTGRLSTAVTLHPIKQGRVTIGSDPTCDIYVLGTGVCGIHCRVENSHGVVTLYPISGSLLLDGLPVDRPTRLSQGSMLTIGRSNYLRFNHPAEAKLMKSVLPGAHLSMAPVQFSPNEDCVQAGYPKSNADQNLSYQNQNLPQKYRDHTLSQLDHELDLTIKEMSRKKPPAVPRKPYKDLEQSDSNSDQESRPKMSSIRAKVSKFEYYAKTQQNKSVGRSQFYTNNDNEISPKVFSSNSLTVNTPAKDVLGGKNAPTNFANRNSEKMILLNENNAVDARNCSYANVAIRQRNKIDEIVRNFDDHNKLPKKINNDQQDNVYGKIQAKTDFKNMADRVQNNLEMEPKRSPCLPSPAFDRNPQYAPVYANSSQNERSTEAECKRIQAYQDRVKEEEQKEAENARLEEILSMCAEYERQIASGTPITPPEKRAHNKIITNGSLPRSVATTNPNFIQTSEGYYKFDTSHNRNHSASRSLPVQRNLSSYENFDVSQLSNSHPEPSTPQVSLNSLNNYENVGRMDEIGIPVFDDYKQELSSPVMIRKLQQNGDLKVQSPVGSPYENVLYGRNSLKPKSPNTQSPRTRIKTTFAHKNLPSPQYFVFPTPPPAENKKPNTAPIPDRKPSVEKSPDEVFERRVTPEKSPTEKIDVEEAKNKMANQHGGQKFAGIEKQLSLEEDIPMIDDSNLHDNIEFRYSKILTDDPKEEVTITKNKSFDDVKKELMADIPELDEFEKDLKENREKVVKNVTKDVKKIDAEVESIESSLSLNDNVKELREKYESLKEERKKLVADIHEIKCKMTEIRSQEDDILRELEMEKALIKGEYDSEIAILNIEQRKKCDLLEKAKQIEEDIRTLKEKQDARQNEMRDRVEVATLKVERLEKDHKDDAANLEELQNAQDILDNETKIYEDLEFQHLEEESELLANREDLQNETILLTKKIEAQKSRILSLKSEANSNLTSALDETKVLRAEYVRLLNQVEGLTTKVQAIEKELKPIVTKLNEIERTQSPDSAFYTDQTRAKSGEFGYSPQSSDSDEVNYENHSKVLNEKFNSIDQMSQSMIVDIERRNISDLIDVTADRYSESPSKSSTSSKEKKGFWERNFDSLKRKKDKKPKSPEKPDIMSQSLNENMFYNNVAIETDNSMDRFNSLRNSKKSKKDQNGPLKSNSSSKIPTFAALGKIIKKDSFTKKNRESDAEEANPKSRYTKNTKVSSENKYSKKSSSPETLAGINEVEVDSPNNKGHNVTFTEGQNSNDSFQYIRVLHRKSCGDEPNIRSDVQKISDSGKIPSQDDIDRISKVTLDAPILGSDADMNTLGKKTVDSLKEIERNRKAILEEQGCQVIESEREKISELKRRVQDETRKLWDQRAQREQARNENSRSDSYRGRSDGSRGGECRSDGSRGGECRSDGSRGEECCSDGSRGGECRSDICRDGECRGGECRGDSGQFDVSARAEDSSLVDEFNVTGSTVFEDSSGFMSSSIEELQVRNSRTESTEEEKRSDDSRPLSHASDFSRELLPLGGARRPRRLEAQRPLTRYLPVVSDDFDLRRHLESAGHQVELCPHVAVTATSCRGYLHKLGAKFHTWSKRWFVFDREAKTFVYYWDKTERKPRGGAYFQVMEEVYLDHGNTSKSPNPQTTFIVKTRQRQYYLMAPSGEAARIWIDAIFTGAQGYTDYLE